MARYFQGGAAGAGGAPTNATYIVQTAHGELSAEQILADLSTGIIRVATGTGILNSVAQPTGAVVGTSDSQTLTSKTIDADSNTLSNIENADIKAAAAIAYSKLNLADSIVNADVSTTAAVAYSKLAGTSGILAIITKSKAAAESVTNSTTLQDDDDLQFTIVANGVYLFMAVVNATSVSANPDWKYLWVEPDGTFELTAEDWTTSSATIINDTGVNEATAAANIVVAANATISARFIGVIKAGGTGGTFKLQWSQNTLDATNAITVEAGSSLIAIRVL